MRLNCYSKMYRLTFILFSLFVCITEASYLSCTDAMGLAENRAEQDEQPMGRALSEGLPDSR